MEGRRDQPPGQTGGNWVPTPQPRVCTPGSWARPATQPGRLQAIDVRLQHSWSTVTKSASTRQARPVRAWRLLPALVSRSTPAVSTGAGTHNLLHAFKPKAEKQLQRAQAGREGEAALRSPNTCAAACACRARRPGGWVESSQSLHYRALNPPAPEQEFRRGTSCWPSGSCHGIPGLAGAASAVAASQPAQPPSLLVLAHNSSIVGASCGSCRVMTARA